MVSSLSPQVSLFFVCADAMSCYFTVQEEVTRLYRRFNTEGRELTLRMTAPPAASAVAQDSAQYFAYSVDEQFEYFRATSNTPTWWAYRSTMRTISRKNI